MHIGNNFYAVNTAGEVFIWGSGYEKPAKITINVKIIDVSGEMLLGEDGRVYNINTPNTYIEYLNSICDLSMGEEHSLFIGLDSLAYAIGEGSSGELGNKKQTTSDSPVIVRTEDTYLEDVTQVSAGSYTSMAVTTGRKSICLRR